MPEKYSFLKDPRALAEIRKHKWLESQRAGRELGFATCAVDWITKYGEQWKKIHVKEDKDYGIFFERRRFRRFPLNCCARLVKNNINLTVNTLDISFYGLLCRAEDYLLSGTAVGINLDRGREPGQNINCNGVIERVSRTDAKKYELFVRFNEDCQESIERYIG